MQRFDPGPIRSQALWESIADALRRAIILGELPAGVHLEEPSLAAKFGVSRIPVREAIIRLAHERLVKIEPRRGAFVVGVSEEDLHDVFELRILLEGYGVRHAARFIGDEGIAALHAVVDRMANAARRGESRATAEDDLQFHREIIAFSGNSRLVTTWEPIGGLVATTLWITNATVDNMPMAAEGHRSIIDALEQRDPDLAERRLKFHIEEGERNTLDAIRRARGTLTNTLLRD